MPNKIDQLVRDYALTSHKDYWQDKLDMLDSVVSNVSLEISELEKVAKETPLSGLVSDGKNLKAIWVLSGSGSYFQPLTTSPADLSISDKPWAHGTDKVRIDYAVDLINRYGPSYLIYNGTKQQNSDLATAIEDGSLVFPKEKLFIPPGKIERTLDQVKMLKFPDINLGKNDQIGIVTHAPHLARVMRIVNKYKTIPTGVRVRIFPLVFNDPVNEKEFAQSEMKGVVGYIANGLATPESYPYLLGLESNRSDQRAFVQVLPIDWADMKSVYKLSNLKSVRKNSFNEKSIELDSHKKWFRNKLNDQNTIMLKALFENNFAGQVRLEVEKDSAIIGISVDGKYRGNGIATILIQESIQVAKKKGLKVIEAYIKPDNKVSISLFEKAGFNFNKKTEMSGHPALKYLYLIK